MSTTKQAQLAADAALVREVMTRLGCRSQRDFARLLDIDEPQVSLMLGNGQRQTRLTKLDRSYFRHFLAEHAPQPENEPTGGQDDDVGKLRITESRPNRA